MALSLEEQERRQKLRHKERMDKLKFKQARQEARDKTKRLSYSKWIIALLVALLMTICVYAMVVMVVFNDFSALPVLISVIAATCLGAVVELLWKSTRENTKNGIVYDMAMQNHEDGSSDG